jgi:hypothetical protein
MNHLRFILLCALASACAAAPVKSTAPPPEDERGRALAAAEDGLHRQEAELGGLTVQGQVVDCPRAFLLRDNICSLSARICVLVQGEPDQAARCADAKARCEAARARVAAVCPEQR